MAQELTGITEAFDAFKRSWEEERYFDAHEDLEQLWFPNRFEKSSEVLLWKGFISAAVSFELMKRGRSEASEVAWQTYLKYRPLLDNLVTPHKELYVTISRLIDDTSTHLS